MRVTVPHNKTKQDARLVVERSIDQLFMGLAIGPLELTDRKKHWSGDNLVFSFAAKLGFLKTPIHGSALVGDYRCDNRCRSRALEQAGPGRVGQEPD
jgi:hypothetical protein